MISEFIYRAQNLCSKLFTKFLRRRVSGQVARTKLLLEKHQTLPKSSKIPKTIRATEFTRKVKNRKLSVNSFLKSKRDFVFINSS